MATKYETIIQVVEDFKNDDRLEKISFKIGDMIVTATRTLHGFNIDIDEGYHGV